MSEQTTVRRLVLRVAAAAALTISGALTSPAAAHADTPGCPGQMICLYEGEQLVATYQDQTAYWQKFNGVHKLTYAENGFNPYSTRTAHVVYFKNRDKGRRRRVCAWCRCSCGCRGDLG